MTLYAIQKLVVDVTEQDLVRDIDWIILPIANPDGYEFSHTNVSKSINILINFIKYKNLLYILYIYLYLFKIYFNITSSATYKHAIWTSSYYYGLNTISNLVLYYSNRLLQDY